MMSRTIRNLFAGAALAGLAAVAFAQSDAAARDAASQSLTLAQAETSAAQRLQSQGTDKAQIARRLQSVETLIEKSSGAKQVEASSNAAAQEKRAKAREVYKQAQEAHAAADYSRASKLLGEASGLMFQAVRLAEPEKVVGAKAKADFETRLASVKALLAAQKRIATEKKAAKDPASASRAIEQQMQEGEKLAAAGNYVEARTALDRAYLLARTAIGSMRGGDTLVRTLNFANKEEEYHYEVDRNDTHQMLIKVLLGDKRGGNLEGMIQGFLDRAKDLRGKADASAGKGDHAGAIKLLEESTAELVKAIRNAGVYIPG